MGAEAKFKARLIKNLKKAGFFCQTIETTTGRGVPDVWACHGSEAFWIECKAPPANQIELRKEQRAWAMQVAVQHTIPIFVVAEHQNDKVITLTHAEKFTESNIVKKDDTGQFKTTTDVCKFLYLYLKSLKKPSPDYQKSPQLSKRYR